MKGKSREMRQTQNDMNSHLEKVKHFHNLDASKYKQLRYQSTTCEGLSYLTRKELVLGFLNLDSGRVLDIGCGPGIFTLDLLNMNLEVFSADLSMEMIRHAKTQTIACLRAGHALFVTSNASEICFSGSKMDGVLCIGVMCYLKNYVEALSEINRVLKPGGTAIIQINNIRWPTIYRRFVPLYRYLKSKITSKSYDGLDFELNLFPWKGFLKDLKASGFQIAEMQYYDFRIPFIDILLPKISIRLGSFMFEKRSLKIMRHFAHGLLIKCNKREENDDR